MSLFLLSGIMGMFLIIILKKPITRMIGHENQIVQRFTNTGWFQNYWFGGIFLFAFNAVLFSSIWLILLALMYLRIPFFYLFVMGGGVILSIYSWVVISHAWQGSKINRLKMGLLGSSFYVLLALFFVYRIITLKPSYPGEDTFMAFIGLVIGFIVATIASITCLIFTGLSQRKRKVI
jgi:hypothetical protein